MKYRKPISIAAVVIPVIGVFTWMLLRPTEPMFNRKPLSFWLAGYDPGQFAVNHPKGPPPPTGQEADRAIQQMGTNAVHALLRILQERDSKMKTALAALFRAQSLIANPLPLQHRRYAALRGLEALGASASNAAPGLIKLYSSDRSPFTQKAVPAILGSIGPPAREAIPMLLLAATHTNYAVRHNAVFALGQIKAEPELVVPVLIQRLNDPQMDVEAQAARSLGRQGKDAQLAISALVEHLRKAPVDNPNGTSRSYDISVSDSWNAFSSLPGGPTPALSADIKQALRAIVPDAAGHSEAIQRGRSFLTNLFDPSLQLLPEYLGANVYWLYHDNYLAAKVLGGSYPRIAQSIRAEIERERVHKSGKIEIIFGEAEDPLPFRQYELVDIRKDSNKVIRTEVVSDRKLDGWENYADLLLLASIAEGGKPEARNCWDAAMRMWDGHGFLDAAAKADGPYSTYKLGLALLAASHLSPSPSPPPGLLDKLLSFQNESGGWVTGYDAAGKKIGLANVETTCLVILGLEAFDTHRNTSPP